jgi:hypothetical protein
LPQISRGFHDAAVHEPGGETIRWSWNAQWPIARTSWRYREHRRCRPARACDVSTYPRRARGGDRDAARVKGAVCSLVCADAPRGWPDARWPASICTRFCTRPEMRVCADREMERASAPCEEAAGIALPFPHPAISFCRTANRCSMRPRALAGFGIRQWLRAGKAISRRRGKRHDGIDYAPAAAARRVLCAAGVFDEFVPIQNGAVVIEFISPTVAKVLNGETNKRRALAPPARQTICLP